MMNHRGHREEDILFKCFIVHSRESNITNVTINDSKLVRLEINNLRKALIFYFSPLRLFLLTSFTVVCETDCMSGIVWTFYCNVLIIYQIAIFNNCNNNFVTQKPL